MSHYLPSIAEKIMNTFMKKIQDKAFPNIRPEWRISPAPSMKLSVPIISDNLIAAFESGSVKSVTGLKKVVSANTVELSDGTQLEVDAIVWCTGYKTSFSLLESKYDPTTSPPAEWTSAPGSNNKLLPRLYQNIFSLELPYSLAFMGNVSFPSPAFQTYDLASMALAQIWKPSSPSPLPSIPAMSAAVDEHHKWVISLAQRGSVFPGIMKSRDWMAWANEAAGTQVIDKLGFGQKGWLFWLKERKLCKTLMTGVFSPHVFRLFDGKRPKWDGAMEAINKANESVKKEKEAAEAAKTKAKGS
jgi:dimethylaniline monooxygenase (N-oxide forming)